MKENSIKKKNKLPMFSSIIVFYCDHLAEEDPIVGPLSATIWVCFVAKVLLTPSSPLRTEPTQKESYSVLSSIAVRQHQHASRFTWQPLPGVIKKR